MGILRTDIVSHSQLPDGNQSVEFDGTGDYLQVPASAAWRVGSANLAHKSVTIEWWVYLNSLSSHAAFGLNALSGMIAYGSNGRYQIIAGGAYLINESNSVLDAVGLNEWHHYALVLRGGAAGAAKNVDFYRDGKLSVSNTYASNLAVGDSTHVLTIGVDQENNSSYLNGFISNFRWSDEVVYKTDFTVPKFKLKALPSTMLLCCQSSTSVTEAAVSVSGSVTSNGDPAVSAFGPGLKDDITDTGVVFDGVTTFDSQAYMVPPSGKTTERNRGRGLIGQGSNTTSPSNVKAISFIEIQSGGTAFDFGDSTNGSMYAMTAVSSSTRAVFAGGHTSQASPYPVTNLLEFVTIANTSNCTDFGDLAVAAANRTGTSNQTRGLIAGGYSPNTRQIDKITIATLGNAGDFGDLSDQGFYGMNQGGMVSSTTRGLFAGGSGNSAPVAVNVITFVVISSDSNSTDFGDLTHTNGYFNVGNSNGTRGIFMGGADIDSPYAVTDQIDFVTIATAGNATDFGSLSTARYAAMGASNSTRGVIAGGRISPTPSLPATNLMEFVNIASTGNGAAFGELIEPERSGAGCSDSHGGLE